MVRGKELLSAMKCNNAKPATHKVTGKPIPARYADGGGLYLHVSETSAKRWVYVGRGLTLKQANGDAEKLALASMANVMSL